MTLPRLESMTVTDFRSIRGAIEVPLDASVILVHGQNGAGKTSLVSALELGLTGRVESLAEVGEGYERYLVRSGASAGSVEVTVSGLEGEGRIATSRVLVDSLGSHGSGLLRAEEARFYNERAYLAQSVLSKLLDIYERSDKKSDSALTRFVNDLLGLDALDRLIEGLEPAGHVRRVDKLVPEVDDARRSLDAMQVELSTVDVELAKVQSELRDLQVAIVAPGTPAVARRTTLEYERLRTIAAELEVMQNRMSQLEGGPTSAALALAELENVRAERARDDWNKSNIGGFTLALQPWIESEALGELSVSSAPGLLESAFNHVETEIEEISSDLNDQASIAKSLASVTATLREKRTELSRLDAIGAELVSSDGFLEIESTLRELLAHVHGDVCPVCLRDYSEVSAEGLERSLAQRIGLYEETAERLREFGEARRSVLAEIALTESEIERVQVRAKSDDARRANAIRHSELEATVRRLESLSSRAEVARSIEQSITSSTARLATLRSQNYEVSAIRVRLAALDRELSQNLFAKNDAASTIDQMRELVAGEIRSIDEERRIVQALQLQRSDIDRTLLRQDAMRARRESLVKRLASVSKSIGEVEKRMKLARSLSRTAVETRSSIVNRVFDDSLNDTWRELFTRLAPGEVFVPKFAQMRGPGNRVLAQLLTEDRNGVGTAGSPGLMLSAGNLNTAALTLFLSLHLTAIPRLPWLILDDPIQSMDDLHVSQFAALMRTFSKTLGRQVVIAVHERELFEYLKLELAPARQGDRIVTVQLSRSGTESLESIDVVEWHEDPAFTASAA